MRKARAWDHDEMGRWIQKGSGRQSIPHAMQSKYLHLCVDSGKWITSTNDFSHLTPILLYDWLGKCKKNTQRALSVKESSVSHLVWRHFYIFSVWRATDLVFLHNHRNWRVASQHIFDIPLRVQDITMRKLQNPVCWILRKIHATAEFIFEKIFEGKCRNKIKKYKIFHIIRHTEFKNIFKDFSWNFIFRYLVRETKYRELT